MKRLVNRQQQIPGGFRFALPEIRYASSPFSSFDSIVNSVLSLTNANPELSQKNSWPVTRQGVEDWVEYAQVQICEQNGWTQYYVGDGVYEPPKPPAPAQGALRNAVVGAKTLFDWLGEGMNPVPEEIAERRAGICVNCPSNRMDAKWSIESIFFKPTAELIRRQIAAAKGMDLETKYHNQLGVCEVCSCPLKLKVFAPLKHILREMPAEVKAKLPLNCWILNESAT